MQIGILGSADDAQCGAVRRALEERGAEVLLLESQALNRGSDATLDHGRFWLGGEAVDRVGAWYLRYVMSPLPPSFERDEQHYLFADWFQSYMERRERLGFVLSWLQAEALRGVPVVNALEHGGVMTLKPFQLWRAGQLGLRTPETLISNNPERVRRFVERVGEVVYKPSMGGGLCRPLAGGDLAQLDLITSAPVTFQERVRGLAVRATVVGDEVVSCVGIPSSALDYRDDPAYRAGDLEYTGVDLPDVVAERCRRLMRDSGLMMSGVDFIRDDSGRFFFLEANSSPVFLDIERKTGAPISARLADLLLWLANEPDWYRDRTAEVGRRRGFVRYAR